jgi:hypothetical protein
LELDSERFGTTTLPLISGTWMYKFNICGLKDDFNEIWGNLSSKDNQDEMKKLLIWLSIILNYFNVHFSFE